VPNPLAPVPEPSPTAGATPTSPRRPAPTPEMSRGGKNAPSSPSSPAAGPPVACSGDGEEREDQGRGPRRRRQRAPRSPCRSDAGETLSFCLPTPVIKYISAILGVDLGLVWYSFTSSFTSSFTTLIAKQPTRNPTLWSASLKTHSHRVMHMVKLQKHGSLPRS
jgi:hypothetical protein